MKDVRRGPGSWSDHAEGWRQFPRVAVAVLALLLCATATHAATSTITIDLEAMKVEPTNPSVNVWGSNAVMIRVTKVPKELTAVQLEGRVDIPTFSGDELVEWDRSERKERPASTSYGFSLPLTIRLLPCQRLVLTGIEDRFLKVAEKLYSKCGFGVWNSSSSITIYSKDRSLPIQILRVDEDGMSRPVFSLVLQLENAPWFIDWSAGFNFLKVEDERYRVDGIGDEETGTLTRVSDVDSEYEFASFAHVLPYQFGGAYGVALGLSTKLPADSLNISLGVSFRLRTFPSGNSAYLTAGAAYARQDRLHHSFEGLSEVPSSLSGDQLVEGRYGVVPFFSVTFGFFDGEKQFKGVYSGKESGDK